MRIPMIAADALLLDQIEPPQEVDLFGQFEELCKAYAMEPPYAARSQIELMFDVYDGRKLQQNSLDEDQQYLVDEDVDQQQQQQAAGDVSPADGDTAAPPADGARSQRHSAPFFGVKSWRSQHRFEVKRRKLAATNFSWCKLASLIRGQKRSSSMRCCLAGSDTQADLCALSLTSALSQAQQAPSQALQFGYQTSATNSNELISATFSPELDDDQEDADLKAEAMRLMGPLAVKLRRSSTLSEAAYCARLEQTMAGEQAGDPAAQQHLLLDGAEFNQHHVSVCLFDKRTNCVQLKHEAENGRHWSRLCGQVEELRRK